MFARLDRLEHGLVDAMPVKPALVLMPGQEAPEGFTGPVVCIEVVDGRVQR